MANTTYPRTAVVLPLKTLEQLLDPRPYHSAIRTAIRQTMQQCTIIFHGSAQLFGEKGEVGMDRRAGWETVQRFLGVVYAYAAREVARLRGGGRELLAVDVRLSTPEDSSGLPNVA
ncbi:hypothetical protein QFC21_006700 [Naganishia friedmannii]|uniref:Uncharacterized protein n=1 Tax=Naganishia friedmannii TaxID=89922 RepID=A0ACC2V0W1_9TREE|nr:hypothetical protein QFC21_006700 [Naganishia friedmannii]